MSFLSLQKIKPNHLTVFRYILIPVIIYFLLAHLYAWSLIFFIVAVLTDIADGALARKRGEITNWGKIADPLADKLLVISIALTFLLQYIAGWIVIAIVVVELLLIISSRYLVTQKKEIAANKIGKAKMGFQSIAIAVLFFHAFFKLPILLNLSIGFLIVAVILGLASLFVYAFALKTSSE